MNRQDVLAVTRGGTTVRVEVAGDGPPMLYFHGLTGLGSVIRQETPAGFRVATYDQRGHGSAQGTWVPRDFTIGEFVADAEAVLDALGWDRVAVGGASMGAAIALRLAVDHPERVSRLALVAPAFGWELNPAMDIFDLMVTGLRALPMAELIPVVRGRQQERGLPEEATAWLENWIAHDPLVLATVVEVVSRWIPFADWHRVQALELPAVVMAWPEDPVHPMATAQAWAEALQASLHLLPSLAEAVTDPTTVAAATTAALREQGCPGAVEEAS